MQLSIYLGTTQRQPVIFTGPNKTAILKQFKNWLKINPRRNFRTHHQSFKGWKWEHLDTYVQKEPDNDQCHVYSYSTYILTDVDILKPIANHTNWEYICEVLCGLLVDRGDWRDEPETTIWQQQQELVAYR